MRFLLLLFILSGYYSYSQSYKISPPVNIELLRKNKIKNFSLYHEYNGIKDPQAYARYELENGLLTNEKLFKEGKLNVERRTVYKGNSTTYELFIAEGTGMKLMEKVIEKTDDKQRVISRNHQKYYGAKEETIELFNPDTKWYEYKIYIKTDAKDTIYMASTIRDNISEKIHFLKYKENGKWRESERAITKFENENAVDYKLYKDGKLNYTWNINDQKEEKKIIPDENYNPLPVGDRKSKSDTLYSANGKAETAGKQKLNKGFIVIHSYGDYAYADKILTTMVYYLNGLPYSQHHTAEKRKTIFEYNGN